MSDSGSGDPAWKGRLMRAKARRDLAEADFCELIAELLETVSVADIDEELVVPREDIEAWAARGRAAGKVPPGQAGRDPYEIAQRYAVGEITHEQMIDALSRWRYVPRHRMVDLGDDIGVSTPGSFGVTVGRAYDDGLISGEDYTRVLGEAEDERPGPR